MAKLITITCQVCGVSRTEWSDWRKRLGSSYYCHPPAPRVPAKQPKPEDVTAPTLLVLAALAEQRGRK